MGFFRKWFVYLYYRFISSMADSRGAMSHELRRYSGPLIVHLLFLVYFRDNPSYRHWRGEAFGFFPHYVTCFKGSHKFPNLKFLEQSIFMWLIDSDLAVRSGFCDKVRREGLPVPEDFEATYSRSILKVEAILHEATRILALEHRISSEQFSTILDRFGL